MKQRLLFLLAALMAGLSASAQTSNGATWDKYFYTGSLSVGKNLTSTVNPLSYAAPSAHLELGKDSTNKGLLLPRVVSTAAITSPAKGLLVWDYSCPCVKVYNGSSWSLLRTDAQNSGLYAALSHTHVISDLTAGILPKAMGGTGTATPALVAGTNVTITGSWPNQTINASGGGGGGTWGSITGTLSAQSDLNTALAAKQATLVSGTNIKTVNGTPLLGSGDISVSGGAVQRYRIAPCFLDIGESNVAGQAANSDLTTAEKAVRPNLQVYNPSTHTIQPLHIGVNNTVNWTGPYGTVDQTLMHGWENGTAYSFEQGKWYSDTGYYLKAGCGGCTIEQLLNNSYIDPQPLIQEFQDSLYNRGIIPQWYIRLSQGINNQLAGSDTAVWRVKMIQYILRERSHLGQLAPVLFPQLMAGHDIYNTAMQRVADSIPLVYVVPINRDSATVQVDGNHWTTAGEAFVAQEIGKYARRHVGQHEAYLQSQTYALSAAPPPAVSTGGGGAINALTWSQLTGVSTSSPDAITKTGGVANTFDGFARSNETFTSGDVLKFQEGAASNTQQKMFGFTSVSTLSAYTQLNYAFYCDAGTVYYVEGSTFSSLGAYSASDRFRLTISGGNVLYEKSPDGTTWSLLRTGSGASGTYYAGGALATSGSKFSNITKN